MLFNGVNPMNDMPLFFTLIEVVMTINLFQEKTEKITSTKELASYILDSVHDSFDEMSEEKRKDMDAKIQAKLESGNKLTPEKLRYLQKYNPMLYAHALRVQVLAKAVEEQLKHARSKEEANRIITGAIAGISKDDPDRKYIFAAINRISTEMHKSPAYNRLPETDADVQKARNKRSEIKFKDAEDEEDSEGDSENDFDLMSWSPLQEVIDSMPTFEAGA